MGLVLNDKKYGGWCSWYSGFRLRFDIDIMLRVLKLYVVNYGNEWYCEDGDLNDW